MRALVAARLAASQPASGQEQREHRWSLGLPAYGSGFACDFSGLDLAARRTFAGRVLMAEGLILIAYLEGVGKSPTEFSTMRAAVLDGVNIARVQGEGAPH
jgi:hypothetical protein